ASGGPLSSSAISLVDDYLRRLQLARLGRGGAVLLTLLLLIGAMSPLAWILPLGTSSTNDDVVMIEPESFLFPGVPLGTPIGEQVVTVAFTPDGSRLVTAGAWSDLPGQLKIWDGTSGQQTAELSRIPAVRATAFSPDGKT